MSVNHPQTVAELAASSSSPNILTLRIHHEKTSFTATLKMLLTANSTHEAKCACSRIRRIWLGADDPDNTVLMPETPQNTTILRFVFRSAANTEKARHLCASSQKPFGTAPFRKRMHELMVALAALCEAEHRSDHTKSRSFAGSALLPFRTNDLGRNAVSEELRAKMLTPLAVSEVQGHGMGYVYILRSQLDCSTVSVLKIGFSKYHPEHRAQELASCLSRPEVVAHTPRMPHGKRIESLIHTELVAKRKVQECGQCGQEHGEWFTISHAESREIVIRWSKWVFQQPYLDGKLSDRWQAYLRKQDFASASPEATMAELWRSILDGFPRQDTDPAPEKQPAYYLNACYFQDLGQRVVGPLKGNFTSLYDALRDLGGGQPPETRDYMSALDDFISSDFDVGTNSGVKPRSGSKLGFLARLHDFNAWKEELRQKKEDMKSLKTGSFSVSHPELGITESPLGDATLLPVLSLKALKWVDASAANWIGYNPTHQGFQFLQEAYQRGEWAGDIPQFKLPRAFRNITKLPTGAAANTNSDIEPPNRTRPTSSRDRPGNSANAQTDTGSPSSKPGGTTARFIRSEGGGKWEFRTEVNDDVIKQANEMCELVKFPLGRALLEKEFAKSFRRLGLDVTGGYATGALSPSSESGESSESDDDKMSIDEPEYMQPEANMREAGSTGKEPASVSTSTPQSDMSSSSSGLTVSKATAKRWLESI